MLKEGCPANGCTWELLLDSAAMCAAIAPPAPPAPPTPGYNPGQLWLLMMVVVCLTILFLLTDCIRTVRQ